MLYVLYESEIIKHRYKDMTVKQISIVFFFKVYSVKYSINVVFLFICFVQNCMATFKYKLF